MIPKGKLLIIGGAEDKRGDETPDIVEHNKEAGRFEILKTLLPKDKRDKKTEVVTTASAVQDEVRKKKTTSTGIGPGKK